MYFIDQAEQVDGTKREQYFSNTSRRGKTSVMLLLSAMQFMQEVSLKGRRSIRRTASAEQISIKTRLQITSYTRLTSLLNIKGHVLL